MPLVVTGFALLPSKDKEVEAFAGELAGPRQAQAHDFYRGLGVRRETWHFQPGPFGAQVIVVTELDDVGAAAKALVDARRPFHRWFKEQVLRISATDPDDHPLGPPSTQVFSWPREPAPGER